MSTRQFRIRRIHATHAAYATLRQLLLQGFSIFIHVIEEFEQRYILF